MNVGEVLVDWQHEVRHARRYRQWDVDQLIGFLEPHRGKRVWPNPATGSLIVVEDGEDVAFIDRDGSQRYADE